MIKINKHYIFWALIIIFGLIILIVNIRYPKYIEQLHSEKNFLILNKLAVGQGRQSINYYIGKINNNLMGPLTNFATHMLLVAICLFYSNYLTSRRFCLLIFIFLILSKFNILFNPPYGDAIGGHFAEAIWLAKNNFNYLGLFNQPGFQAGGPRVYMFSIYPTYLAILLKLIPLTKIFLMVNHLIIFFFCALIVTIVRSIVLENFDKNISTLCAIVLLSFPVFQNQTEAITMEVPCLLFTVLAAYFLIKKKITKASLLSVMALLVKGHGIVICCAVFLISILLIFDNTHKNTNKLKLIFFGISPILAVLLKVSTKYILKDQHVSLMNLFAGLPLFHYMVIHKFYLWSLLLFSVFILFKAKGIRYLREVVYGKYFPQLVVFILAGIWFLIYMNFKVIIPRYTLILIPFLVLSVSFSLLNFNFLRKVAQFFLISAIAITSLSSYGYFYKPLIENYEVQYERSLEYRNELGMYKNMVNTVQEKYRGYTIGAPFIVAQMFAIPELGYVKEPLDVMTYDMPLSYGNIRSFNGFNKDIILKTIWIAVAAQFINKGEFRYPVSLKDKVLEKIQFGDNYGVMFRGGFSIYQRWLYIHKYLINSRNKENK